MKTGTPLKRTKGLNKKSSKQIIKDQLWARIKLARVMFLTEKYGVTICEYCGLPGWGNELGIFDGHHIDGNRNRNTEDNCYICHRMCHSFITDHNLVVKQLGFEGVKHGN